MIENSIYNECVYIFDISEYKGYRYNFEYKFLSTVQKIKIDGFEILYSSKQSITFKINKKLERLLKIKKIADDLKLDRKIEMILELISKSKIADSKYDISESLKISYEYTYYNYYNYYDDCVCNEKINMYDTDKNKYLNNKYKQSFKNYGNKFKNRK